MWVVAGVSAFGAAAVVCVLARIPFGPRRAPSPSRQAALLAIAAGIAWGFVAAVIKELSSHLSGGLYGVLTNWSPYVLIASGAAALFLASNAFQAGSLAASQPGLTIVDPLVASTLGVVLFGEHIRHDPLQLVGEGLALVILVASVILLSRSQLVQGQAADGLDRPEQPARAPVEAPAPAGKTALALTLFEAPDGGGTSRPADEPSPEPGARTRRDRARPG